MDADDVEPVEEILAELAGGDGLFEGFIGGGDDADIDFDGLIAADAFESAGLENAEDLGLGGGGHVADFVQEKGATIALLKFADALHGGAGEGAAFVTEEFAFEELFGDGGAIDSEERLGAAIRVVINGAGDKFFAGAAFAGDESGGIGGGQLTDNFEHLLHALATANDALFVVFGFEKRLIRDDLLHVTRGLEGVGDNFFEFWDVERLKEIIVGAKLHGLDGGLRGAVGGHEDDQQLGVDLADAAKGFEAGNAAHANVHQDKVGLELGNKAKALFSARSGGQLDFRRIKDPLERVLHVRLIVN